MKKRLFALATAVVMTLSMGMPAMAAKSPVVNDTPGEEVRGYFAESATAVIDGKVVQLDFTFKTANMENEATEAQFEQIRYYMPSDRSLCTKGKESYLKR